LFTDTGQTELMPVILPGVAGTVFTVTFNVFAALEPQLAEFATTVTLPLVALAVVFILVVVEVPVQPEGKVHV